MSKNKNYTVFLYTGVNISLPSEVDIYSPEGYEICRNKAYDQLIPMLKSDNLKFEWERADEFN